MVLIAQLGALLFSASLLLMGNGLQTTALPLRGGIEGFSALSLGIMGSSYFVGFVAGCLSTAGLVGKVGHIRVFTAMAAIASVIPLLHMLSIEEWAWWLLRAGTGYCMASLFLVIESWLNERTDNSARGTVFSVYASLSFLAIILGQIVLATQESVGVAPFVAASILVSLAAVPVALNNAVAPAPIAKVRLEPLRLMRLAPSGTGGCFAAGVVNGAFWSLAPVAANSAGLDTRGIATFIAITVLGGAISQWPFGRLSDRIDRRVVIVIAAGFSAVMAGSLFLASRYWGQGVLPLAFVFGIFTFPIYALSVAHVNDLITVESFVEVSGSLLLLNGAGAVLGPLVGALAMGFGGPGALFAGMGLAYLLLTIFVLARIRRVARPAEMHGSDYVAAVDTGVTAPVSYDPRNPQPQKAASEGVNRSPFAEHNAKT